MPKRPRSTTIIPSGSSAPPNETASSASPVVSCALQHLFYPELDASPHALHARIGHCFIQGVAIPLFRFDASAATEEDDNAEEAKAVVVNDAMSVSLPALMYPPDRDCPSVYPRPAVLLCDVTDVPDRAALTTGELFVTSPPKASVLLLCHPATKTVTLRVGHSYCLAMLSCATKATAWVLLSGDGHKVSQALQSANTVDFSSRELLPLLVACQGCLDFATSLSRELGKENASSLQLESGLDGSTLRPNWLLGWWWFCQHQFNTSGDANNSSSSSAPLTIKEREDRLKGMLVPPNGLEEALNLWNQRSAAERTEHTQRAMRSMRFVRD